MENITIKTMTPEEKAKNLVSAMCGNNCSEKNINRMIAPAIISIRNEYYSTRELLFDLKSSGVEISEKLYLHHVQRLINEEQEVIKEIKKL